MNDQTGDKMDGDGSDSCRLPTMNIRQVFQRCRYFHERTNPVLLFYCVISSAFIAGMTSVALLFWPEGMSPGALRKWEWLVNASSLALFAFASISTLVAAISTISLIRSGAKNILLAVPGFLLFLFMVFFVVSMSCQLILHDVPDFIRKPIYFFTGG